MLCIIAPEYESRDDETRHRSADGEESENAKSDDAADGELLTAGAL